MNSLEPNKKDWIDCPVCGSPDTRRETDSEGDALIFCTNHACASNGGGNASTLRPTRLPANFEICPKPGCGARRIIGHPCYDWDCPQRFVSAEEYQALERQYR